MCKSPLIRRECLDRPTMDLVGFIQIQIPNQRNRRLVCVRLSTEMSQEGRKGWRDAGREGGRPENKHLRKYKMWKTHSKSTLWRTRQIFLYLCISQVIMWRFCATKWEVSWETKRGKPLLSQCWFRIFSFIHLYTYTFQRGKLITSFNLQWRN